MSEVSETQDILDNFPERDEDGYVIAYSVVSNSGEVLARNLPTRKVAEEAQHRQLGSLDYFNRVVRDRVVDGNGEMIQDQKCAKGM